MTFQYFGSVSSGTMRPEDLIPDFAFVLQKLDIDKKHAELIAEANAIEDFDSADDNVCDVLSELFDALQEYAPDYCYFGSHPGDGADYGFWLNEDWEQMAKDDGVEFVDDSSKIPDDANGLFCVVNDHGNCTLYAHDAGRGSREIWSVV